MSNIALEERFLHPGEYYFGAQPMLLKTLLGSCVSIVLWHAVTQCGGMCHIKLPRRIKRKSDCLDGTYAEDIEIILADFFKRVNIRPTEFRCGVYGGGAMFRTSSRVSSIGLANIEAANAIVKGFGLIPVEQLVGGAIHRRLSFNMASGELVIRENPILNRMGGDVI